MEEDIPFCTYSLTSLADLPRPSATPTRFIDVIGRITMVSDIILIHPCIIVASKTRARRSRLPCDGAVEFDVDMVHAVCEKEPLIPIFVGTLPKTVHGFKRAQW